VAVKSSRDISAKLVWGQKIEEHVVTNLDQRNDDNRASLTSGAAEERQDVSSINTIDELSDAITGGKNIGLWSSNIPEKMRGYWLMLNMMFYNTEKRETRHGNALQILCVARTTMPKSLKEVGFVFLLHKLAFTVSRVD